MQRNSSLRKRWLLAAIPALVLLCCVVISGGVFLTRSRWMTPVRAFLPAWRATAVTPRDSAEPSATPTTPPVDAPVILAEERLQETHSDSPKYALDLRYPRLEWPGKPAVDPFNDAVRQTVQADIQSFQERLKDLAGAPVPDEMGSSLWMDYTAQHTSNGIVSVLVRVSYYFAGAAHPGTYFHAFNYDLAQARMLALDDLFQPGVDYLPVLSQYCQSELEQRSVLTWNDGLLPRPENYRVWTITGDGLQITFDEYSIAPYAAGPQNVIVPYAELEGMLRRGGPLERLVPQP